MRLPRLAVFGEVRPRSAKMKQIAAIRSPSRMPVPEAHLGLLSAPGAGEASLWSGLLGGCRTLNISSMRSVTTNPPTTFNVARITATKPRIICVVPHGRAEDEHRADDDDTVDGVRARHQRSVQRARHLRDDLEADEGGEHENGDQREDVAAVHPPPPSSSSRVGPWRTSPSYVTHVPLDDLVVEVGGELALLHDERQELGDVARVQEAGVQRHGAREVPDPDDGNAVDLEVLAGPAELEVASRLGGKVDDDAASSHLAGHLARHEDRRPAPGDGGGRDHDVGGGDLLADELPLAAQEVLGLLPGVTAFALLGLELELDEGRAEALHLVSCGRPDVVRADDGAEPARRRNRLQSGDAGAEHEDLGGRHGPGRRHVEGEELRQVLGCQQGPAVSGYERLGGERVHRLRTADPRQKVQAEGGNSPRWPSARTSSRSAPGWRKLKVAAPSFSSWTSSTVGGWTLQTIAEEAKSFAASSINVTPLAT